ncbi:protein jagged-1b isoform X2 [Chrysoperla carnea]|uniref:protein jagged-1b isoform X2 n=1 Tax=Chrysoperla carnea TaxID=189513 RepID=UPI001D094CED|nr:protein jagged-1b isoform X2 [Chrysoperla carnea]
MCRVVWRLLCKSMSHGYLLLLFLFLLQFLQCVRCRGYFELQILAITNYRGELASGECCGGLPRPTGGGACTQPCHTLFRVCLKEYQSNVSPTGLCSFGNISSPVLGTNTFTLADPERSKLKLPFTFRWTRSFTLILQAVDHNNYTQPGKDIIEEAIYSGIIVPSEEWHPLSHTGKNAMINYLVRVQCDTHYYNTTCTKFCRPRDDKFGHYKCNSKGDKECIDGWTGTNCEIAVCKPGCHPTHGKCDLPGECGCRQGWRGEFCDQCTPYPGCKHGYCNGTSWQCICDTNWGGILCDQDLNYCGTHEPCQNDGTCANTAPDSYLCTCPEGFSGVNCEIVDNPCATAPCQHGGTCHETAATGTAVGGQFTCTCPPGWTGITCQIDVDECASAPCQNGGTCIDQENGFRCECPPAWEGSVCQIDADECVTNPCINAVSCTNLVGDYRCKCQNGWSGKNCDHNINDCVGQCQHGATCIDLVNDYHCACQAGYTGRDCHTDINDCESNPCKNGGECVDQVDSYRCICPVGFTGHQCEDDHDHCSPNPCVNGAHCFTTQSDYYCHCPEMWQGKNCSIPRTLDTSCNGGACDNGGIVDSCTVPTVSGNGNGNIITTTNICGEHGHCVSQPGGGFRCSCVPGYTGKYCHENINDCKVNPCQNGGTCVDKINSFQCMCKEGWEGEVCEKNTNECSSNPCQNNASCIDSIADFICECRDGWKGKTCALKDGHCDRNTCRNGGTCQDLGNTYTCHCPPEWEGTSCHIAKVLACKSNPCLNGGTCVNTGEYYSCICKDGFEGQHCEKDIDDCNPPPCYNNGKCVDGVNWFLCECAPGFTGPDCRININECSSNPCGYGSTCVDGIGDFQCICPPGRSGPRCEQVENVPYIPGFCIWNGNYLVNNATWFNDCNTCICEEGKVKCTRVWCGLGNCLGQSTPNGRSVICQSNQVCVPSPRESCLTAPCTPWGECRNLESGRRVGPPSLPAPQSCWPNQATLSNACARLTLLLDRNKLPIGVTTEKLCISMRKLLAAHQASQGLQDVLILLCDLKTGFNDTIEVTLSSNTREVENKAVLDGIKVLAEAISRKQTSLEALTSIVEVKVETAFAVSEEKSGSTIALVCIILIIICTIICAAVFYWHQGRRGRSLSGVNLSGSTGDSCHRHHDDEKSNNLQNEENLRRYANTLKEEGSSIGGSMGSLRAKVSVVRPMSAMLPVDSSTEMLEMISETDCQGRSNKGVSMVVAGPSNDLQFNPAHRKSQILLYKAQNADVRKNTVAYDDSCAHKDFPKRAINMNVLPHVQRTNALPIDSGGSDNLTILMGVP